MGPLGYFPKSEAEVAQQWHKKPWAVMFQGHFPHESSDEIMAFWGNSLPGFLGLNPKPTTADFSVCLQDHLNQLACIRSFWGVRVCVCAHSVMSDSLQPCGLKPARLLCPWDSPDKNTGVGCHVLLQRIFLTLRLKLCLLCLLHQQPGSLLLVPRGKPQKLLKGV